MLRAGLLVADDPAMLSDVRYALRMMRSSPGFTAVAILTLALGIGANTAIFSVVRHMLLNSLPYPSADRIAMIYLQDPAHGFPKDEMSYPRFADIRWQIHAFSGVAAFTESSCVLSGVDEPEQLTEAQVSADFFGVLAVAPKLGRGFKNGEDEPGNDGVAVISHGLWARRFGANAGVLGSKVTFNARPYTVIGVMPSSFEFPDAKTDVWVPLAPEAKRRAERGSIWLGVVGRLRNGVSIAAAKAELDALNQTLGEKFPNTDKRDGTLVNPLRDDATESVRLPLILIACAVGCVLLIACANVASMMLARAAGREREISVRVAIGARTARIVQQLVTESLVLFLIGGTAGILVSYWSVDLLVRLAPANLAELGRVRIDPWTMCFAFVLSVVTGMIFGLVPALNAVRGRMNFALKQRGAAALNQRFRHGMVIGQIAIAIALLASSGLLIRSFLKLGEMHLGFIPDHLLTFRVALPQSKYSSPGMTQFFTALTDRLRALHGVRAAAATNALLLSELPNAAGGFVVEGRAEEKGVVDVPIAITVVTPGFFAAFGQPLVEGRDFNGLDRPGSATVAIVNRRTAKQYWPNQSPIGKRFHFAGDNNWLTIVGVAADTRRRGLDRDIWLETYTPMAQGPRRALTIIVRTSGDPLLLANTIREQVRALDRDQPVSLIAPMERLLDDRIAPRRFYMLLLLILAATALILAAVGLYGVLAYLVTLRTQEIGVRMALGATAADVLAMISARSLRLVLAGTAGGMILSLAATNWISSLLYGVSPRDPVALTFAALTIAVAAAAASYVPARRASRVDPIVALRYE